MVQFTSPGELDSRPPIEEEQLEETGKKIAEERAEEELKKGKVPLYPALIRLPVSLAGNIAYERTGYPGFQFSDRDLADFTEVWMQLGIQVSPLAQAIVATVSLFGLKFVGYYQWKRAGKPERKPAEPSAEEMAEGE